MRCAEPPMHDTMLRHRPAQRQHAAGKGWVGGGGGGVAVLMLMVALCCWPFHFCRQLPRKNTNTLSQHKDEWLFRPLRARSMRPGMIQCYPASVQNLRYLLSFTHDIACVCRLRRHRRRLDEWKIVCVEMFCAKLFEGVARKSIALTNVIVMLEWQDDDDVVASIAITSTTGTSDRTRSTFSTHKSPKLIEFTELRQPFASRARQPY